MKETKDIFAIIHTHYESVEIHLKGPKDNMDYVKDFILLGKGTDKNQAIKDSINFLSDAIVRLVQMTD